MSVEPKVRVTRERRRPRRPGRAANAPAYFATGWTGGHNPWAIALVVTMATFMEVLDTSIANVSLPHIAGNLSVSQDESTWVLTLVPGVERDGAADQRLDRLARSGASAST